MIYWVTGRKDAGKTTWATQKVKELKEQGRAVLVLDGDAVRQHFKAGFSDEERENHIMRIAKIAAIAESQGIDVIIALVSPKKIWRQQARQLFRESKLFFIPGGTLWAGTTYEEPDQEEEPIRVIREALEYSDKKQENF